MKQTFYGGGFFFVNMYADVCNICSSDPTISKAVIRIVTALFLKETLASAALDSDMVMEDNRRAAVEAQTKLEELFRAADDDGDGHWC